MPKKILCCKCGSYKESKFFESKRHKHCKECEAGDPRIAGWRVVHGEFLSPTEKPTYTHKQRPNRCALYGRALSP